MMGSGALAFMFAAKEYVQKKIAEVLGRVE